MEISNAIYKTLIWIIIALLRNHLTAFKTGFIQSSIATRPLIRKPFVFILFAIDSKQVSESLIAHSIHANRIMVNNQGW